MKTVDLESVVIEVKGAAAMCRIITDHRSELSNEEQDNVMYMLSDLMNEKADNLKKAFYEGK